MNSLVKFWKDFDSSGIVGSRLYSHPADADFVKSNARLFDHTIHTPQTFRTSEAFGNFEDTKFRLSLLPVPYLGDLKRADIFILLLNPGFGITEFEDDADPNLRQCLVDTLTQNLRGAEYPFCKLDPALCRTAGFRWWEAKLRKIARTFVGESFTYSDSLQAISSRLACIQLVPYHSAKFVGGQRIHHLPSSLAAVRYVQTELRPRAEKGDILIVILRQPERWSLKERRGAIINYHRNERRGAFLTPVSRGGRAILERLYGQWGDS